MVVVKIDSKNNLSKADFKALATAALPIFVLIVLSFFLFRVLLGKVDNQRMSLSKLRRDETILREKQELLGELSSEVVFLVEPVAFAIPHKNASLMMIAQVRQQALGRGLFVTNLKAGPAIIDNDLMRYEVQFDIDGGQNQILEFVSSLSSVAPISKLEGLILSIVGGVSRGEVTLSVYTAPLPEKLPSITEPITEFTDEELKVIDRLTSLVPPPFFEVTAQEPEVRENPFD